MTKTIRSRIREQAKHDPASSPAAISSAIVRALPDSELRAALSIALPYLVRDEVRKTRHQSLGAGAHAWEEPAAAPPADALTGPRRRAAARKASDAAQAKLSREAALLATGVVVNGQWKQLGDCTPADLRALARENTRRAEENTARAEGYERLAANMEAAGIRHVRDYEEVGVVRQVFADAA